VIYLIGKIFLYMLLTLAIGVAAGWLSRNIVGAKREEELQKSVTESRARVPQFESLMRSRDEQVRKLRDELSGKDRRIAELSAEIQGKEEQARRAEREVSKLSSRNQALEGVADDSSASSDVLMDGGLVEPAGSISSASSAELDTLREELAALKQQLADATAEAASAEAELANMRQAASGSGAASASEVRELQARVQQQASEYEQLSRALETEQRKVIELERERELQNKSLQVLHQQLELERERTAQMPAAAAADPAQAARH
jgi:chromosome segregation ATPase